MTTYIFVDSGGGVAGGSSQYWGDAVANFASLPGSGVVVGESRLVLDTHVVYHWDGAAWEINNQEIASVAHGNTDSVVLTSPGEVLQADLNLSADAATAGFYKATTTVKSGANKGLHVEIEEAATAQTGVLTSTDWNTFNNKEPAITAATADDYYRGDKTFQTLDVAALKADETAGLPAIGNVLGTSISTNTLTTTGVGATTVWGAVSGVSLTLNEGAYILSGIIEWADNGATLSNSVIAGYSTSATGTPGTFEKVEFPFISAGSGETFRMALPMFLVSVSAASTTYYLNTNFTYTGGTPQHGGLLQAIRIK